MKKTLATLGAALAATAALAAPATADESAVNPCAGEVTEVATPAGTFYIDNRSPEDPSSGNVWVYEESNGIGGYQAGGTHEVFGYVDESADGAGDCQAYTVDAEGAKTFLAPDRLLY